MDVTIPGAKTSNCEACGRVFRSSAGVEVVCNTCKRLVGLGIATLEQLKAESAAKRN